MKELNLFINDIFDLKILENMSSLERLNIGQNNIDDNSLEHIKNLFNLKELLLHNNDISRIDSLNNLTNLENLTLGHTNITNLNVIGEVYFPYL